MKNLICFFLFSLLSLTASSANTDKAINEAYDAFDKDDIVKMHEICHDIMDKHWQETTFENRCDLSILYYGIVMLYQESSPADADNFLKCHRSVMTENQKAYEKYLNSIQDGFYNDILNLEQFIEEYR